VQVRRSSFSDRARPDSEFIRAAPVDDDLRLLPMATCVCCLVFIVRPFLFVAGSACATEATEVILGTDCGAVEQRRPLAAIEILYRSQRSAAKTKGITPFISYGATDARVDE
jgi:hypothetical protein